jgi:hypothetical protein
MHAVNAVSIGTAAAIPVRLLLSIKPARLKRSLATPEILGHTGFAQNIVG